MPVNRSKTDRVDGMACIALLVAALLLVSCQPGAIVPSATVPAVPTAAASMAALTPTAATPPSPTAPAPTATTQPTVTLAPSNTPPSSPAPTVTLAPTVPPEIAVIQPITVADAPRVVLLDRLGTGALQDMVWLPDGRTVVAAFYSGLSLRDAGSLHERGFIPTYGLKASLVASPDGRHIAMITGEGVQLWDLSTGRLVHTLEAPASGARLIAFGAGGQILAVSGSVKVGEPPAETVAVWNLAGLLDGSAAAGELLYRLEGFPKGVSGMAFSPDGKVLVSARWYDSSAPSGTPYLDLWDAATGEPVPLQGDLGAAPDGLQHLAFSPDGNVLAGDHASIIYVWDVGSGTLLRALDNQAFLYSLALSADGRWLVAGSPDKTARVWDVPAGELRTTLSGHTEWITRVAFDPAASSAAGAVLVATATSRDGIQLWDATSGERIAACRPVGNTSGVEGMVYSPDGELLATASSDQTVWLWDAESGQPRGMLDAYGMNTPESYCACIWSVAFSPDGKTVVTGSTDARVRLWDVVSGELLDTSEAMGDLVGAVDISPDGRRLAAGDKDGNLWVWDLSAALGSGPLLALDNGGVIVSLSFDPAPSSPSGHILATGSGSGTIRVWDVDTGVLVRELKGSGNIVRTVYSPDGSTLAAGDGGWTDEFPVRLWDPATGELRQNLQGHTKDVGGLAFTSDSRVLASGDWSGITKLWEVATGKELQTLEQPSTVKAVALRPDGGRLATAGFDSLIWLWGVP